MIKMVVSGICACCGRHDLALYTCKACGARVCPSCVDPKSGFCKLCGGIRRVGRTRRTDDIRK